MSTSLTVSLRLVERVPVCRLFPCRTYVWVRSVEDTGRVGDTGPWDSGRMGTDDESNLL